ncbi:MAG: hypothetical protein HPM95_18130 [Alphaproteobacteria bacterium]|nr:hypothetical protein [Alphaproteobacteria bacterium]
MIDQRVLSGTKTPFSWEAFTRPPDEDYGMHLYGTPGLFQQFVAGGNRFFSGGLSAEVCNTNEQLGFCLAGHYSGKALLQRHMVLIGASIALCLLIAAVTQRKVYTRLAYRRSIPGRIARALRRSDYGGFHCHYQPIIDLGSGRIVGVEALPASGTKPARSLRTSSSPKSTRRMIPGPLPNGSSASSPTILER